MASLKMVNAETRIPEHRGKTVMQLCSPIWGRKKVSLAICFSHQVVTVRSFLAKVVSEDHQYAIMTRLTMQYQTSAQRSLKENLIIYCRAGQKIACGSDAAHQGILSCPQQGLWPYPAYSRGAAWAVAHAGGSATDTAGPLPWHPSLFALYPLPGQVGG